MDDKPNVEEIIEKVCDDICNHYCKWPVTWDPEDHGGMELAESGICDECPLNRLH